MKVETPELRKLRSEVTSAQSWLEKVDEYNNSQGSMPVNSAKHLIAEHEQLLVDMPEEIEELKQAIVGYCLCRRPYDGFMIGCDHCEVRDFLSPIIRWGLCGIFCELFLTYVTFL